MSAHIAVSLCGGDKLRRWARISEIDDWLDECLRHGATPDTKIDLTRGSFTAYIEIDDD